MDDPGCSWPAWKFGMKREDLFTKLHDQYNTFPSAIQDPEAFHHDVYEVSISAQSADDFHRLLSERRQQRLIELENGLESASLEIIANPRLIGTAQWQLALQLFRTKSLDSLVRYFSSYLPEHHPLDKSDISTATTAVASFDAGDDESGPFFDAYTDDTPVLTHEPLSISTDISLHHLPPSPRSLTMCSDSSTGPSVSPIDPKDRDYMFNTLTPARTLSFSEPESDCMAFSAALLQNNAKDNLVRFDAVDTPSTSVSDMSEVRSLGSEAGDDDDDIPETQVNEIDDSHDLEVNDSKQLDRNNSDSSAVTIRPATEAAPYGSTLLYSKVLYEHARSSSRKSRDGSPKGMNRKSPGLSNGRIQKPLPDATRTRLCSQRRMDC